MRACVRSHHVKLTIEILVACHSFLPAPCAAVFPAVHINAAADEPHGATANAFDIDGSCIARSNARDCLPEAFVPARGDIVEYSSRDRFEHGYGWAPRPYYEWNKHGQLASCRPLACCSGIGTIGSLLLQGVCLNCAVVPRSRSPADMTTLHASSLRSVSKCSSWF